MEFKNNKSIKSTQIFVVKKSTIICIKDVNSSGISINKKCIFYSKFCPTNKSVNDTLHS